MGRFRNKDILNTPHLKFIEVGDTGKTKKYEVHTTHILDDELSKLGEIRWYGSWRNYVFYPEPGTLYDHRCMNQISYYMDLCKEAWQNGKKGISAKDKICTKCMAIGRSKTCEDCHGTGLVG